MSKARARLLALAALLVAALVAAGCGGSDSGEEEQGAEATPDNAPLVVALDTDVNLLEPHTFRTFGAYAVTRLLYEPLLDQTFEDQDGLLVGTDDFQGAAAKSIDISEDGREVRITIREDATFASGSPVTAEDVAYTFQRSIEGPGYIGALLPFLHISSVEQIEVVGERELVLRPTAASPLLERFLTFQVFAPLEKAVAEQHATPDDPWAFDWFMTNSTPAGPYVISEYKPGDRVVLDPNPHYQGPAEVGDRQIVVLSVPAAEERGLLLQRGELDLASGLPPAQLRQLEEDDNVTVHAVDSSRTNYLGMNTKMAPLDNVDVRRAISYAIPYETLIQQVMHGYATKAGNLITPANETYAGDEIGSYETDLDEARKLLEKAGVGDFSFELAVRQSRAEDRQAATFIQENLRQIGIDVSLSILPDGEFAQRLNAKELPLFINDFIGWGEDPFYKMNFLAHTGEFTNFTQYSNPKLDALIDEGIFESDPKRRAELSRDAQQILLDDAPMAYLYAPQWVVATRANVTGAGKDLTEVIRLERLRRVDD